MVALDGFIAVPMGHHRMRGVLAVGRAVRESQDQKERDDSRGAAGGAGRVALVVTSDSSPGAAGMRPDVVVAGHIRVRGGAGLRPESSTMVMVPLGLLRIDARPPSLRCHITIAAAMTVPMAKGIAIGGYMVMVRGMPTATDRAVVIWKLAVNTGSPWLVQDSPLTKGDLAHA